MQRNTITIFFFLLSVCLSGQNTVGLLSQQPDKIYEGYNLLFPHNQNQVYLIDNCGEIVHTWEGNADARPGNAVYLLENGNLVQCVRDRFSGPTDPLWAGGAGESVEIRTWEDELLHRFTLNNAKMRLHHDVEPLPNGNILMIAWHQKTPAQALAAGRDPEKITQEKLWTEVILEWNPTRDEIVWEWHAWDHLIQNFDQTKENFGNPLTNPERIDLNYDTHNGHPDWLHINSIAYNPVLDQIALSVPYFNEVWIVDHSTTTEEAETNNGGNSSKGGDLLYRWGNPAAYRAAPALEQQFFFQHDIKWINPKAQPNEEDFGKISLFNNRVGATTSTGNTLNTLTNGVYQLQNGKYLPETFERTLRYEERTEAFSNSVSSMQVLSNGNSLLCAGRFGFGYEITPEDEVVWEYKVPIISGRTISQGELPGIGDNLTFRMTRYAPDYPAFERRDLSPKGYWELNPNEAFCGTVSVKNEDIKAAFEVYPNPVTEYLILEVERKVRLNIYHITGKWMQSLTLQTGRQQLDVGNWESGIYLLVDEFGETQKVLLH